MEANREDREPPVVFAQRSHWLKAPFERLLIPARNANGVTLTFDDGPIPVRTREVQERLRAHNLRAYFFVLGNRVEQYPEQVRSLADDGHIIGNHSHTHVLLRWWESSKAAAELARCQQQITQTLGQTPRYFRAPLGRWTPWLTSMLAQRVRPFGWTLDSGDWRVRSATQAEQCAREIVAAARPGDVILLHDANPWIAPILDRILPELLSRGWLSPGSTPQTNPHCNVSLTEKK